jgi:hypothetical protein
MQHRKGIEEEVRLVRAENTTTSQRALGSLEPDDASPGNLPSATGTRPATFILYCVQVPEIACSRLIDFSNPLARYLRINGHTDCVEHENENPPGGMPQIGLSWHPFRSIV